MSFMSELAALSRIIITVKIYRQQTNDFRNPVDNAAVNTYLKQQLSIANWKVWERAGCGQEDVLYVDGMAYA